MVGKKFIKGGEFFVANIITYYLTDTEVTSEDFESVITYGLMAKDNNENICINITDISTSCEFVNDIVSMFNRHGASICHVMDIVEDMLP